MQGRELNSKEIGKRIAQARREADGMTQRELADLLAVTERSVAAYEAGDVVPYRFMRQLEEVLQRPAAWLLYGEDAVPAVQTEQIEAIVEMMNSLEKKLDRRLKEIVKLLEQSKSNDGHMANH
jgi:transcriptional regulator with XRE-family HTH domain